MKKYVVAALLTLATLAQANAAGDWGTLKGRLVFDGAVEAKAIDVNKDVEVCGTHNLVDEEITVGKKNGLTNAFVYLYLKKGKSVEIHPDLQKPSSEPVQLDNKGCRFEPHVALLRLGQPLELKNSDSVGHNTNIGGKNSFNQIIPAGGAVPFMPQKEEVYPVNVSCSIHPWMKSYLLIRNNPYGAATAADGSFEIKDIPAGKHEFIFWHEAKGNLRDLPVQGKKTNRKGRAKIKILAGQTLDLGDIKVTAKLLGK